MLRVCCTTIGKSLHTGQHVNPNIPKLGFGQANLQHLLSRSGSLRKSPKFCSLESRNGILRNYATIPLGRPHGGRKVFHMGVGGMGRKGGATLLVFGGIGWMWATTPQQSNFFATNPTNCEGDEQLMVVAVRRPSVRVRLLNDDQNSLWSRIKRALKVVRRLFKLALVFSPVVALYPLHWLQTTLRKALAGASLEDENIDGTKIDAHQLALMADDGSSSIYIDWYYQLCLFCVEWSGAACIKTMQWAGSRPDMFGKDFCAIFSKLQDSTRPHAWKHTVQAMVEAYGIDWDKRIRLHEDEILGSGCIAQVYKGEILSDDETNGRPVAVKVMHPNVHADIDADLDILRLTVRLLESIRFGPIQNLKWLNLPGFIEEMAIMLKIQLDLRQEGEHLVQFNKNFESNPTILFPQLVEDFAPTQKVLVESFCEGKPLMEFIQQEKADQAMLTKLCKEAIKAVCQMIFLDNFCHGDLHPGNVLVTEDYKFVLLDVGITTVHSDQDHRLVSDVLAAFIRKNGRKAGRYMIDNSNARLELVGDRAVDEEKFIDKIELLTIAASGKDYFMEHLGTYISYICNCASTHHVMLNQAFISSALAVKVQEGIGLALDPSIQIAKVAIPIIMEGERRHGRLGERAKEILSLDTLREWWTGEKTIRYTLENDGIGEENKERVVVYSSSR